MNALNDDLLAGFQPQLYGNIHAHIPAGFDTTDDGFPVLDRENIKALLVRDQRGLWDDDFFLRLPKVGVDANELAIDQHAVRVGEGGANGNGIGYFVDTNIDEIDGSLVLVDCIMPRANSAFLISASKMMPKPRAIPFDIRQ